MKRNEFDLIQFVFLTMLNHWSGRGGAGALPAKSRISSAAGKCFLYSYIFIEKKNEHQNLLLFE